jgi:hypothetical protein
MHIPMPGHVLTSDMMQSAQEAVAQLHQLVATHDAVFLLTDSRESRWLPTVMAKAQGKLTFTLALGFDSFLVMRHGLENPNASPDHPLEDHNTPLGCYFCNDVVAPANVSLLSPSLTLYSLFGTVLWTNNALSVAQHSLSLRVPWLSSLWSLSCTTLKGIYPPYVDTLT